MRVVSIFSCNSHKENKKNNISQRVKCFLRLKCFFVSSHIRFHLKSHPPTAGNLHLLKCSCTRGRRKQWQCWRQVSEWLHVQSVVQIGSVWTTPGINKLTNPTRICTKIKLLSKVTDWGSCQQIHFNMCNLTRIKTYSPFCIMSLDASAQSFYMFVVQFLSVLYPMRRRCALFTISTRLCRHRDFKKTTNQKMFTLIL